MLWHARLHARLSPPLPQIPIQPYWQQAPKTTERVLALARESGGCQGCNFYRNEAVPPVGGSAGWHKRGCCCAACPALPCPPTCRRPSRCRAAGCMRLPRVLQPSLTWRAPPGAARCPAGRHGRAALRAAAGQPAPQRQPSQGEPGADGVGGPAAGLPGRCLPARPPAWDACRGGGLAGLLRAACMRAAAPPSPWHARPATRAPLPLPPVRCSPRMVGFIGGSNDFFIAVMDHRDWGGAFIV
jgi:hypothetical protein